MKNSKIVILVIASLFVTAETLAQELISSNSYRAQMNQSRLKSSDDTFSYSDSPFLQKRYSKHRPPMKSRGFFNGSSDSLILSPLRGKSRHAQVL